MVRHCASKRPPFKISQSMKPPDRHWNIRTDESKLTGLRCTTQRSDLHLKSTVFTFKKKPNKTNKKKKQENTQHNENQGWKARH